MARTNGNGTSSDPSALTPVLGLTFVKRLTKPTLIIGSDSWNYWECVHTLHTNNFKCILTLNALAEEMSAKNIRDMFTRTSPYELGRTEGAGVTTLYALWRVYEALGFDLEEWWHRGQEEAQRTFATIKREQYKIARKEKEGTKKRRRAERKVAQEEAVQKFAPRLAAGRNRKAVSA